MQDNSKSLVFLKRIEIFKYLTPDELRIVVDKIERRRYKAHTIVFRENTSRKNLFLIYNV